MDKNCIQDIALATGHYPLHAHNGTIIYGTFILMHTKHKMVSNTVLRALYSYVIVYAVCTVYAIYTVYVSLWMGKSKGQAGIQCIPEKRDTTEMYPRKVMHIIGR